MGDDDEIVLVCEPICWGNEHVPVNAGIIKIILHAFPHKQIFFWGESAHSEALRKQIGRFYAKKIIWEPIDLAPRFIERDKRTREDARLIYSAIKFLKTKSQGHLVFCSTLPIMLILTKLFLTIYGNLRAHFIFHGNLNEIDDRQPRNPFLRLQTIRSALLVGSNEKIRYLVLEESIRKAFIKRIPSLKRFVYSLDHPVPPNEDRPDLLNLQEPIKFGFLGLACEEKGFSLFLEIASLLSKEYPGKVEFHAIGSILDNRLNYDFSILKTKPGIVQLNRKEYVEKVKNMHFICFPYSNTHYELSASGALLDAIIFEKPFISNDTLLFKSLMTQFGDVGYICRNREEYLNSFKDIIENAEETRYRNQVALLKKNKNYAASRSIVKKIQTNFLVGERRRYINFSISSLMQSIIMAQN